MITLALAIAIAAGDSVPAAAPRREPPHAHADSASSRDPWFGRDKLLHFTASALIQTVAHSVLRANGRGYGDASRGAAVATAAAGIGKEWWDRHRGRDFSLRDLTWDGIGGVAGAVVNRQRDR